MDSSESDEFATSSAEFAGPGDAIGCFYDGFDVINQPRCGQGVYALSSKAHRIDKPPKVMTSMQGACLIATPETPITSHFVNTLCMSD
jgi:hypothetical protein